MSKPLYFRIHSPAILIELDKQASLQKASGPANHIHSIMRTPGNDYGVDWMRQHHLDFDHAYHYRGRACGGASYAVGQLPPAHPSL